MWDICGLREVMCQVGRGHWYAKPSPVYDKPTPLSVLRFKYCLLLSTGLGRQADRVCFGKC